MPTSADLRLRETLASIAPGTALRDGLERILRGRTGALIVIGRDKLVDSLCTGGFELDVPFTATGLRELAKMDGAIIIDGNVNRIIRAAVHLMPDQSIPSEETGTRHRTADRVAKQTGHPVISVSQSMQIIAAYVGETKGYVKRNAVRLYWAFNSPILSKLEQDGLRELAELAKPGERVMNDGGDGTVWTYALTGVEPVVGHYISQKPSPRRQLLLDDFDELGTNPSVAQAVRDLNVHYVLVGTGYMGQFRRAPGLTNLDGLPQLTLKYANADIALYEVDWSKMAPTTATQ